MQLFFLLFLALLIPPAQGFTLTLAGTGDSQALLQLLAGVYQSHHPAAQISVPASIGSSGGIRLLLEGRTDLARIARPLSHTEIAQGLEVRQFAQVPILFVANLPEPCISDLTSQQVLNIFSGRITNWSELGRCPSHKIYLARREIGDSSNAVLNRVIKGLEQIERPKGKTLYTTQETFATLAKYPYTIGYLPQTQLLASQLTHFSFNGVSANNATISSGEYQLQLQLGLVWKAPLTAEARQFLQFLNSAEAHQYIRNFGAIPVPLEDL